MSELVPLFCCTLCPARMYEQDCAGHIERHAQAGADVNPARYPKYFTRGKREVHRRPGDNFVPLYHKRSA